MPEALPPISMLEILFCVRAEKLEGRRSSEMRRKIKLNRSKLVQVGKMMKKQLKGNAQPYRRKWHHAATAPEVT
jgi:hypothetical protein